MEKINLRDYEATVGELFEVVLTCVKQTSAAFWMSGESSSLQIHIKDIVFANGSTINEAYGGGKNVHVAALNFFWKRHCFFFSF